MKPTLILFSILMLALAGCSTHEHPAEPGKEEVTLAVTRWSDKSELFMEHPPLHVDGDHRFAIHVTDLKTFAPLTSGTVEVVLSGPGGAQTFRSAAPSRPGIFGADVKPRTAGVFNMRIKVDSGAVRDEHDAGSVTVYPSAKAAQEAAPPDEPESVRFLKEQQWTLEYASEVARERELRAGFLAPGVIEPRAGGAAEVIAPVAGKLIVDRPVLVGTAVARGQVLGRLVPLVTSAVNESALEADAAQADSALQLATRERERMERLVAAQAVPAKRLDEARAAELTARARAQAARDTLSQSHAVRGGSSAAPSGVAFSLVSPLSGTVASAAATAGASVNAGDVLYHIVAADVVHVRADIPEQFAARAAAITGAELRFGDKTIPLARPLSRGHVLDPRTRTLPVLFSLKNTAAIPVGQAVELRLFTGTVEKGIAVPESAVLDDGGQPIVFVQVSGEGFARRGVKLGARDSGYVHVLDGIKPGEHVVSRGGYLIRLAALSPQVPAHGHAH